LSCRYPHPKLILNGEGQSSSQAPQESLGNKLSVHADQDDQEAISDELTSKHAANVDINFRIVPLAK
ncbi:MAG: hypothetical protein H0X29_09960, partial [Parachlamydiaceae bacterium]|nr:hypothetical protein [Parachlamydiaceae bacterium]